MVCPAPPYGVRTDKPTFGGILMNKEFLYELLDSMSVSAMRSSCRKR